MSSTLAPSRTNELTKHSKILAFIVSLLLSAGAISYYFLYGKQGMLLDNVAGGTTMTATWFNNILIRYGLGILRDAALLWMFIYLSKTHQIRDAMHFWLYAFTGGCFILLLGYLLQFPVSKDTLYGQFFIITRGRLPIITGIIIFVLLNSWIKKQIGKLNIRGLLIFLLFVPLVFNIDIFGFNIGDASTNLTSIIVLGILALCILDKPMKFNRFWFSLLLGVFSVVIMILIEENGGITLNNCARFIGLMSPLSILPALALVSLIDKTFKLSPTMSVKSNLNHISMNTILFSILLMGTNTYYGIARKLYNPLRIFFQQFGIFWIVFTIISLTVLTFIIGMLALLCRFAQIWQTIDVNWSFEFPHILKKSYDWKKLCQRLWHDHWRAIVALLALLVTQIFSALLMNQSFIVQGNIWQTNKTLNIFAFLFAQLFSRQIVGTIVLLSIYWILFGLTNRYWVSLLTPTFFTIIFAIANRLKIEYRSEPIVIADTSELKQLPELISMISPLMIVIFIILIVVLITLIILLEKHSKKVKHPWYTRLSKTLTAGLFLLSFGFINHTYSPTTIALTTMHTTMANINPTRFAQWYGPVLQYLTGLDVQTMAVPTNYSKKTIQKIVKRYQAEANTINKTRTNSLKDTTVIFNLSESFSDPSHLSDLIINSEPAPYIQQLKKETTSGEMMSFGYGGGTANMEYMTLTGTSIGAFDTTLTTPYTQLVPKLSEAPNISDDFSYSSAIHPYTGGFYNRIAVYSKFGFDKFAYLGSKYKIIDQKKLKNSPYLSDDTAYANAIKQVNSRKGGQFINLITIQNHLPFSNWYQNNSYKVTEKKAGFVTNKITAETYAEGVHYTDKAVKVFREKIDKINKPIIWVFYGDHLPGLYSGFSSPLEQYETDYFVYANKYARAHGSKLKLTNTSYVGPNDFISLAYSQANAKVNAYSALMTEVQAKLPAQWMKSENSRENSTTGTTFVNENGTRVNYDTLTKKQKKLYHDYQLVMYDINAGQQYSLKYGMKQ